MFRRGYHRKSDDTTSSYGGFDTLQDAMDDALECSKSRDIDQVWVRDEQEQVIFRMSC